MHSKEVNLSFYITVFEREVAVQTTKDEYFLKEFAIKMFKDELKTLRIEKGIERASILNLQKISSN